MGPSLLGLQTAHVVNLAALLGPLVQAGDCEAMLEVGGSLEVTCLRVEVLRIYFGSHILLVHCQNLKIVVAGSPSIQVVSNGSAWVVVGARSGSVSEGLAELSLVIVDAGSVAWVSIVV